MAAVGAFFLLFGFGVATQRFPRRGQFGRWYHHQYRSMSWPYRNGLFLAIPLGTLCLVLAVMTIVMTFSPDRGSMDGLTALLWLLVIGPPMALVLGLIALTLVVMFRVPNWLKPAWLREDEARLKAGLPSLVPVPPEGDRPVMSRLSVALVVAASIVITVGVVRYGWPPAALVGIGFGLSMLARARIKAGEAKPG